MDFVFVVFFLNHFMMRDFASLPTLSGQRLKVSWGRRGSCCLVDLVDKCSRVVGAGSFWCVGKERAGLDGSWMSRLARVWCQDWEVTGLMQGAV